MTLQRAFEYGQEKLSQVGIMEAELDAWLLLEFVTGICRAVYYMDTQRALTEEQESRYRACIDRRARRIPLQHITGVQEFMGLEFLVNEHVLVPRQDTEILVETVLRDLRSGMQLLDMCTGSGCILLSLLKLQSGVSGVGVDISEEALAVAKQNCKKQGVDAQLMQSDLFEKVEGTFDVIVSNPPYIRTAVIEELQEEVKLHDPMLALDGMEDGLHFYRRIVEESPKYLREGGKLYFEIGHEQAADVMQLMKETGFTEIVLKKDLAGLDRVVFGTYNK